MGNLTCIEENKVMLSKWQCGLFWVVSQIWSFSSFCGFLILIEKETKQQQRSPNEQKATNKENHHKNHPKLAVLKKCKTIFFSLTGLLLASGQKSVSAVQSSVECYTSLMFDFNFESLSVTLYNSDMNQVCDKAFII